MRFFFTIGLAQKLRPLTKALFETNTIVQESVKILEECDWSIDALAKNANTLPVDDVNYTLDSLDQLIVCARCLTEDVRQFASFVQVNKNIKIYSITFHMRQDFSSMIFFF